MSSRTTADLPRHTLTQPGRIRCFTNGEWKERSEFSTRQLDKFKRSGASAANSQISCREHTAQVRRELKCEGPCGDWYPIEVFSRSTRSHSKTVSLLCADCCLWQTEDTLQLTRICSGACIAPSGSSVSSLATPLSTPRLLLTWKKTPPERSACSKLPAPIEFPKQWQIALWM